jgi:hypothetical protein
MQIKYLAQRLMPYQTRSAILLTIFNRPDTTLQVFEQIRAVRPHRLYVAGDGPRTNRPQEAELCEQARAVVNLVDWPCEVKTLFRDTNLGCKEAMSSAITWFFDEEEEGIVLEDDCYPSVTFFEYCDVLLERYRFDTRIRHIGGVNHQQGAVYGDGSYYFSNLTHVWGWASWRRVWKDYDKDLKKYSVAALRKRMRKIFDNPFITHTWENIFKTVKDGKIDTWDYQLTFLNFFNNGLSTIPNRNLNTNIGFGSNATHASDVTDRNASLPLQHLDEIIHPTVIIPQKQADMFTMSYDFSLVESLSPKHNKLSRRFKRWVKGLFCPLANKKGHLHSTDDPKNKPKRSESLEFYT